MVDFNYRYIIFVEWAYVSTANAFAAGWDPDSGGEGTFGDVRLSPTGEDPPTHSACSTLCSDAMKAQIESNLSGQAWADLYLVNGWTWPTALADMGLQVINPEDNL